MTAVQVEWLSSVSRNSQLALLTTQKVNLCTPQLPLLGPDTEPTGCEKQAPCQVFYS